ncbi:MAG TPA: TIM barrel protein [Pirellulales bacterium]|nr:TIM barrel protein [Pirellulales bacterium]
MVVGFSTGSLALGNVRLGLQMVEGHATAAVELSALREEELVPLVESLDDLDLTGFRYISLHAPSKLRSMSEIEVARLLCPVAERGWPIVVHPDVIGSFDPWRTLGDRLCIENMDKRKPTGRTAGELAAFFRELPDATLCFDIGHARQIDPTMCEADAILRKFGGRLQQVHLSLVNSQGGHEPLNYEAMLAFRRVSHLLPENVPIILETPVRAAGIEKELKKVGWLTEPLEA